MRRKILFMTIPSFIILGVTLFLFYRSESLPAVLKHIPIFQRVDAEASRLSLHPLTTEQAREEYMKRPVKTWEEWADKVTERGLGYLVQWDPELDTPEKIAKERAEIREGWEPFVQYGKSQQEIPPQPGEESRTWKMGDVLDIGVIPSRRHEGPQTTEALMASFDENYVRITPQTADWDAHYPREEWIQMLLDKGVYFENRSDYDQYLDMRNHIIMAESHPEWWDSGLSGVARVDTFEDYKDAYIRRRVFQQETFKSVQKSDPDMVSLMWPSERPDKYLVMKGDRLYVRLKHESLSMSMWGKLVSREEARDLNLNGILPKDREVIFIDENYDIISEAEVRKARKENEEKNTLPFPPDAVGTYDKEPSSIENFDYLDDDFLGDTEDFGSMEFDIEAARSEAAREAINEMMEAEKVSFERFQNDLRTLAEFSNMSDAEIAAELERQILQKFTPDIPTDDSINRALNTLDQYGFKEGFRRIRRDNPTVADMLEKFFGQPSDVPPERPKNIPPSPNDSR